MSVKHWKNILRALVINCGERFMKLLRHFKIILQRLYSPVCFTKLEKKKKKFSK